MFVFFTTIKNKKIIIIIIYYFSQFCGTAEIQLGSSSTVLLGIAYAAVFSWDLLTSKGGWDGTSKIASLFSAPGPVPTWPQIIQ